MASNNQTLNAEAIINQIHREHAQTVAAAEETGVVAEAPEAPVEPESVEGGGRRKRAHKRTHKRKRTHRRTHRRTQRRTRR